MRPTDRGSLQATGAFVVQSGSPPSLQPPSAERCNTPTLTGTRSEFLGSKLQFEQLSIFQAPRRCQLEQHAPGRAFAVASPTAPSAGATAKATKHVVIIAGFESFNKALYQDAAKAAVAQCGGQLSVDVFSDRDLGERRGEVENALARADVFFASLLFDFDAVEWLRDRVEHVPVRLVFESALELMALTRIGDFTLGGSQPKGMPKPVQFILSKFSNSREEDKLAGYLSFLKAGPKLLKYVPVKKVQDLRSWLVIYGYWNAGGEENVAAMLLLLARDRLGLQVGAVPEVSSAPALGLLHPARPAHYFESPREYVEWYKRQFPDRASRPAVAILLYRKHVVTKQPYIPTLISGFEDAGLIPVPIFINGVEGHVAVRDLLTTPYELARRAEGVRESPALSPNAAVVDAVVSTIGFPLVGGPAGSMEAGRQVEVAKRILQAKNVPYVVSAPLLIQDIKSWTRQGIGGLQSVVLYSLPELDGAIDPVPLGGLVGDKIYVVPERVKRLTGRLNRWIALRRKPAAERKVAIVLYGFPPGYGAAGTAALLNVPKSLVALLRAMKAEGYAVGDVPDDFGERLISMVKHADEGTPDPLAVEGEEERLAEAGLAPGLARVSAQALGTWLGWLKAERVKKAWGGLTTSGIKTQGDELLVGGLRAGEGVWVGLQPPLGIAGDPMRLLFERDLTPHPQYAAFYLWLQNVYKADAVIHFGMHGTFEWLPGSPLGNTGDSWPDVLIGDMPNLYVYAANNPSESILAKRRGLGVLVSHCVPPYGRAGLYKQLAELRGLLSEARGGDACDPGAAAANMPLLWPAIATLVKDAGLDADCALPASVEGPEDASSLQERQEYVVRLYEYLGVLENRLFSSGLHVLGARPSPADMRGYLEAYSGDALPPDAILYLANGMDADEVLRRMGDAAESVDTAALEEAVRVRDLLDECPEEIRSILRGLNGEFIPPAPGGDLLRDGPGALPTGRNIHSLDPYRMPSPAAYERGRAIAEQLIEQHRAEHGGAYPETIAVLLWGLDAIKTKGESVGVLLGLVGARPLKEGTGRIVRYELVPLEELGRPRIDVLGNLSGRGGAGAQGIFRDSFANVIELLDDLFARAAEADEPEELNFVRKHARAMAGKGLEAPTARLFSNPAGDYGSMVNEQVVSSTWESSSELGATWASRNAFSYGRADKGANRSEVLAALLETTDAVVQEIDSVEYGLTDIQEYYANTGAWCAPPRTSGRPPRPERRPRPSVKAKFVESFSRDSTPRPLDDVLRVEYRTKLLNPKWAQAMARQGSGGAYEISQRMTAMIGWGATTGFKETFVYDQAAETYALDEEMARRLQAANPEAFRNVLGRLIEAHGRGFWEPKEGVLERLQAMFEDAEVAPSRPAPPQSRRGPSRSCD
eukprot:tig00000383_g24642.t1